VNGASRFPIVAVAVGKKLDNFGTVKEIVLPRA
jgi:hypothetical protein